MSTWGELEYLETGTAPKRASQIWLVRKVGSCSVATKLPSSSLDKEHRLARGVFKAGACGRVCGGRGYVCARFVVEEHPLSILLEETLTRIVDGATASGVKMNKGFGRSLQRCSVPTGDW